MNTDLPLDRILEGDCVELLAGLPAESVDMVFADPPYNLQLQKELRRPDNSLVDAVNERWDQFSSFAEYDTFTRAWLSACRRVLKPTGTLWVIGSYHNIYRVGAVLQDLDFWILNDVVWIKSNPMPNFRGVRFTNAHETLIWAQKDRGARYTFNHQTMRALNEELQMRSDWYLPLCVGRERLRANGAKLHPTQKPAALLYRVLAASTRPGDVVLDPFFGTGTTGEAAIRLGRHWIGMEKEPQYIKHARERLDGIKPDPDVDGPCEKPEVRQRIRLPFGSLLEYGYLRPGDVLCLGPQSGIQAVITAQGRLQLDGQTGSIHGLASQLQGRQANGWTDWYYRDPADNRLYPIDRLRQTILHSQEKTSDE
ncbi:MAG: site-specific DNA-methyltransferase [Leptolinea sp.]|nr:site-specific DNA-methyltransferase [Leptolinea sp.]